MWCPPTLAALGLIAGYGFPVVEIGAGDGEWLAALQTVGVPCLGFDPRPGDGVTLGDHRDAAKHPGAMLAVWPPDGTPVADWIRAADWPIIFLCANHGRLVIGDALDSYELRETLDLPPNATRDKGWSELRAYVLEPRYA